jgi:hypothetical protein
MTVFPAALARRYAATIDRRDWEALRALLADDCRVELLHSGEVFGPDEWVRFNADYPGEWRFAVEDAIAGDGRAVVRARVFDQETTFHVAVFLTLEGGLIREVTEVWTDEVRTGGEQNSSDREQ